ncbi:hypothetical protein [Legionella dresdenensis]
MTRQIKRKATYIGLVNHYDNCHYYNQCGQVKVIDEYNHSISTAPEGFIKGVQLSNISFLKQQLNNAIKARDVEEFKALLQTDFIYRIISKYDDDLWSVTHVDQGRVCEVRSNIEALLLGDLNFFLHMLNELLQSADESFYQALIESLQKADLSKTLLLWDNKLKTQLIRQINELERYGEKLKQKVKYAPDKISRTKSECAINIAKDLLKKVQVQPADNEPQANDLKKQVDILQFKLQLLQDLHRHDKDFAIHRGWKRMISNLCSLLLTGGIANLINYALTENFLFFNHTSTQHKVEKIQNEIGLDPKEYTL